MSLKAALEESQDGDIIRESSGVRIALHKRLGPGTATITIGYSDSEFTAILAS